MRPRHCRPPTGAVIRVGYQGDRTWTAPAGVVVPQPLGHRDERLAPCEDDRVTDSEGVLHVSEAQGSDSAMEAALIWARARARRDKEPEPATGENTMPGIQRRLSLDGAKLLLARRDGRTVGFALLAPRARTLEVFYLAVDPLAWGIGVASRLLLSVEKHAQDIGRDILELWVINDNERAIRAYERSGWLGTDAVMRDAASGRIERRFLRHVGQDRSSCASAVRSDGRVRPAR